MDARIDAMPPITVRCMTVEDWAAYRAVRLAALADAPEAFGSTLAREQAFTVDQWRGRLAPRSTFVAEDSGAARGLIGMLPVDACVAELVSLWVHPAARARGVGDRLVRAAMHWARDRGFHRVRLWVADGNDGAERLYTRHGFRRAGPVQPVQAGSDRLEFAMIRSAPAGDVPSGDRPPDGTCG